MSTKRRWEWTEVTGVTLGKFPQYDLEFLFDEEENPTEVTVYVDDACKLSTNWLTVDIDHAVPLEEIR